MTKVIDAALFSQMIISGAHNLSNNREYVDSLNIFPVPDGDTGTNMSLTFINAARTLESEGPSAASGVASAVAKATLRGARGNSGVILSQIFRGISKSISKDTVDVATFKEALKNGSNTAYRAVMKPTEGTVLTVIRLVSEAGEAFCGDDLLEFFEHICTEGNKALALTQNMLPQLSQAGVVDAGGQGLMYILEGFLECLKGSPVVLSGNAPASASALPQQTIRTEDIKFAYCTEFIINKNNPKITAAKMRAAIEPKGDSMIVIDEDDIVKVHIHTNHPGFVLEQAVKLGEMVNIKIENMREQHTDIISSANKKEENKEPKKPLAVVSVANGEGLEKIFRELGVSTIINGGQTMNPSTEDILAAINEANAENVIVLPNNKNIVMSAQQAVEIADCKVFVAASKTIPQGISAMMAFSPDESADDNFEAMQSALESVKSGSVTHAVKDTEMDGMEIHEGNIIGVSGSHILSVDEDIDVAAISLIEKLVDEDSEIITLYYGNEVMESDAQNLSSILEDKFPDFDIVLLNGGQSVYYYIISVE